jgi:hypothetical protein
MVVGEKNSKEWMIQGWQNLVVMYKKKTHSYWLVERRLDPRHTK